MNVVGFIGKSTTSVDNKGRCSFPKELRKFLAPENEGRVVITVGSAGSLTLYPVKEWNAFVELLAKRPRTMKNEDFRRWVTNMATESVLDGQNRISLTPGLCRHAGITSEVTFTGDGLTVGLWNPVTYSARYENFSEEDMGKFDEMFYWDDSEGGQQ
jgi:MraZ protein